LHITVSRDERGEIIEVFVKSNGGMQGHLEVAAKLISLGIQGRCDVDTVIRHLRHDKTHPQGIVNQPSSIYDALAQVLEREMHAK
jgi:hypothetical protein